MLRVSLLALFSVFALEGKSAAQTLHALAPLESVKPEEYVKVRVEVMHPGATVGGYGYVRLRLRNPGASARTIHCAIRDSVTTGNLILIEKTQDLLPGTTALIYMPFPCSGMSGKLSLSIDGLERGSQRLFKKGASSGIHSLCITERPDYTSRIETLISSANKIAGGSSGLMARLVDPIPCRWDQLPPHWSWLTGFDLITLDGESPGIETSTQELLTRFVRGGGNLLVTSGEALPKGPLRDLIEQHGEVGVTGLGRAFGLMPPLEKFPASTIEFAGWLIGHPHSPVSPHRRDFPGPAPRDLYQTVPVPGVAGMPTSVFFLIIFAFVFVIGPVNHILLRRRGRPWLVLITVPISGFLVTAFILGYAIFSEGFGAQAIVHSVTILDQRSHLISTVSTHTVFAGLSPAFLAPPRDSYIFAESQTVTHPKTPKYQWNVDNSQLDGAILPSRRPTNFVTAAVKTCRERIQMEPAKLRYRYSERLSPHDSAGAIVFCDNTGQYYVSDGMEQIRKVSVRAAELAINQLATTFKPFTRSQPQVYEWLNDRLGTSLLPGTYLGRFDAAPSEDGLGLKDVTYNRSAHLILGILADKDVLK